MIDIKHYVKSSLNEDDSNKFLKFFGKYEFNSLYSMKKHFSDMENKLDWVKKTNLKDELITLSNRFVLHLNQFEIPLEEKIEFLESQINIVDSFPEFEWKKKNHGGICPECGERELFVPKQGNANGIKCSRENQCGYYSSIFKYLKDYKNLSTSEALKELASLGGVDLKMYEQSKEVHTTKQNLSYKVAKKIVTYERKNESKEVVYNRFDSKKPYKLVNFDDMMQHYPQMNDKQQFMMIVTSIYNYSLNTNQNDKVKYFKSRGISAIKHPALLQKVKQIRDEIGYLSMDDISHLINYLKNQFSIDDLIKFGIINDKKHKFPYSFKHYSLEGFCVIPSFDLYSNMITALKIRNTKMADWQKSNMKEPEISFGRIATPLPYGLTRDALLDENATFRLQEGAIDSLSVPSKQNTYDISIAGVNGISNEDLGLFENKKVEIWYDQDSAGQKTAYGQKVFTARLKNTELAHYSLLMKFNNCNSEYIQTSNDENGMDLTITSINHQTYLNQVQKDLDLLKSKNVPIKTSIKKGIKDLLLDAGADEVIIKNWNKELGSDVNEVLKNNNIEKI